MCYSLKNILKATNAVLISWVISGSPMTTESIVGIDTWFGRFGVFRKKMSSHDPRGKVAEFGRSQIPKRIKI